MLINKPIERLSTWSSFHLELFMIAGQDGREGVMLQDAKCQVRRRWGGGFELFGGKFLLEVIINITGHDYLQLGWNGFGDVARCQVRRRWGGKFELGLFSARARGAGRVMHHVCQVKWVVKEPAKKAVICMSWVNIEQALSLTTISLISTVWLNTNLWNP